MIWPSGSSRETFSSSFLSSWHSWSKWTLLEAQRSEHIGIRHSIEQFTATMITVKQHNMQLLKVPYLWHHYDLLLNMEPFTISTRWQHIRVPWNVALGSNTHSLIERPNFASTKRGCFFPNSALVVHLSTRRLCSGMPTLINSFNGSQLRLVCSFSWLVSK